jgi:hypothetical protein
VKALVGHTNSNTLQFVNPCLDQEAAIRATVLP